MNNNTQMVLSKNALTLTQCFISIDPRHDHDCTVGVALCDLIDLRFARIAYLDGKADIEQKRRDRVRFKRRQRIVYPRFVPSQRQLVQKETNQADKLRQSIFD